MAKRSFYSVLGLLLCFSAMGQTQRKASLVLHSGDSLEGELRYEKGKLFRGTEFRPKGGEWAFYASDTVRHLKMGEKTYVSLSLPEEKAGIDQDALAERLVDGRMELFRSSFLYRSCTCQDRPEVREGEFLRKEGEEGVHLARKNRLLDRIKNPEDIAFLFLPFEDLKEKVKGRRFKFSELPDAVERYNEKFAERSPEGS